jgi:adenine/guanine/hypoxanthine permease
VICALFALSRPTPREPEPGERDEVVEGNTFTEAPEGGVPVASVS